MRSAIKTENLTREFIGGTGVFGVDLDVPESSVYAFLGLNGAGKTTTIRLLLGLLRPDAGTIEINGLSLHRRVEVLSSIGAMIESPSLYPNLTGVENLSCTGIMLGIHSKRINEVLEKVGLRTAANQRVNTYSMGMKQRLAIAQALLANPCLLIMDEPSNGLDPEGMAEVRAILDQLVKQEGVTVFLSSHLLADVEKVATHIGILHKGQLVLQGRIDDMRKENVKILCDEPTRALEVLNEVGCGPFEIGEKSITFSAGTHDGSRINTLLVQAGVAVRELSVESKGLERIFADAVGLGAKAC